MGKFWAFRNQTADSAELLLYGDISDVSWWDDEVTPKKFSEELNGLGTVNKLTVRINSGGGDVFAAQAIGNLLEANGAETTAMIDGLCASAATIVACHCDKVLAAVDGTYMIHPVKMGLTGYYEAKELKDYMGALDTIRDNIITVYARKTGRERDEVAAWMDDTSWWTSREAKEKGFVDELVDMGKPVVENRNGMLFVNSVETHMPVERAPENWQKDLAAGAAGDFANKRPEQREEETDVEIKTVDELRQALPELVMQIEQEAAQKAENAERQRIRDIEEMATPGNEALTQEAKFDAPMSAEHYAMAAMKRAKAQASAYLAGAAKDAESANGVKQAEAAAEQDEFMDAIKSVKK